jgi:hypothetical protein
MHNIDEMLEDIGINVGAGVRLRQWLLPIDPLAYGQLFAPLRERYAARAVGQA